ncbi:hypothetical protein [Catellatospora sichuanensis]|uniref:hypothetical protein n=1 Tax=Catellatospora sichuanensis TaxID=1969805 RepID=UPI001183377C|nr:hypothetical protein [Catellatospora sichuanensis]
MGGTALCVFSPHPAELVEPIVLAAFRAEGLIRHGSDAGDWHDTDGRPYGYRMEAVDFEFGPEATQPLEQVAGIAMACQVQIHIWISDPRGRPALGRIAQRVADRVDGWVYVDLHDPPPAGIRGHFDRAGRRVVADDDGTAFFLDAAAMAAWLGHPDFYVIK